MGSHIVLRTNRQSSTSGTKGVASIIASSAGGAGSSVRSYRFIAKQENLSGSDYFFNYLGGKRSSIPAFNNFYNLYRQYPQ